MRIHFISIGGSIMHSLAIELKRNGHSISGSDDIIYEPAKSNLIKNNLLPNEEGWLIHRITDDLDLVILGMHAKLDNPELLEAKRKNISILSFPEFIYKYSQHKKRIVISGSHGKTSITAMIIHVLKLHRIKVDYLVGAQTDLIKNQVSLGNNKVIIIEGDEYLSSALDRRPKFMHYNPDILVVSGVAWDHINVFPSLSSYQDAFKQIITQTLSKNNKIFYCNEDNFLSHFLDKQDENTTPYSFPEYLIEDNSCHILFNNCKIKLNIFGKHNLLNIEAAKNVCKELGVSEEYFYNGIQSFKGANRRLTLLKHINKHSSVYYDFAHSPSKVRATIDAIKDIYSKRKLIACLELHTFSSLNKKFLPNYHDIFLKCNHSLVYISKNSLQDKYTNSIDAHFIRESFNDDSIVVIEDKKLLQKRLRSISFNNTNLLLMTSGNFSNLDLESLFN